MREKTFKGLFLENKLLKIMALAFAIALWFLVVGEKKSEVGFLIPMELKNIPKDMVMIGEPAREIEVRVLGSRKVLANLSPSKFAVSIDLSTTRSGYNNIRISPQDIKAPNAIEIIKIIPSPVVIHLEAIIGKLVPVKVKLSGLPSPGFIVKGVTVKPEAVTVFGTQIQLKDINEVWTPPLDISGIQTDRIRTLAIQIADTGLKKVEPETVKVKVSVTILKKRKRI